MRCTNQIVVDSANQEDDTHDDHYTNCVSDHIRSLKCNFPYWRKHTINEKRIMNDLKQAGLDYDKITQFLLRPRELKPIVDKVGLYYRWFEIEMKEKISSDDMDLYLKMI